MKKLKIIIISMCLLLGVGCSNKESVEEGKSSLPVNLIITSESKYFTEGEFIGEDNKEDGYYKQTYKYGNITFIFERMKHKDYSDFPVAVEDKEIYDLKYKDQSINDEMNTELSYPALKATYNTKTDNKEVFNEDILISTDEWDFRVHLESDKDSYDKNSSIIEDIVNNLKVDEIS